MNVKKNVRCVLVVAASAIIPAAANAVEILFAHVNNNFAPYHADGNEIAGYIDALSGYNVTIRDLNTAVYSDFASFDQVWVYDLYHYADDKSATQMSNYANIATWYSALGATQKNLIVDGRIISSAWANESTWIQNYALELMAGGRTGGLLLGSDHSAFVSGINEINAAINIGLIHGDAPSSYAVVDQLSPLYTAAGTFVCPGAPGAQCIWDNSTPGYVPTGLQANGQTLTPVAYHGTVSGAWDNAAVSSTIGSRTFGTCGEPGQPPCDEDLPEPASLALLGIGLAGIGVRRRKLLK